MPGEEIPKTKTHWLLGIVDKINHKVHVQFIPNKEFLSIILVITRHVRPGCTINTDGANVYKCLSQMSYQHNVVIHKDCYVTPDGIHTNWIENFWSNLKAILKSVCGSQGSMLDAHIDEYVYRYNRKGEGDVFNLLLK